MPAEGSYHRYTTLNQLGRQCRQSMVVSLRPAQFYLQVLTFGVADLIQAFAKCVQQMRERRARSGAQKPDHRRRCLLRAQSEGPSDRHTSSGANYKNELPPLH